VLSDCGGGAGAGEGAGGGAAGGGVRGACPFPGTAPLWPSSLPPPLVIGRCPSVRVGSLEVCEMAEVPEKRPEEDWGLPRPFLGRSRRSSKWSDPDVPSSATGSVNLDWRIGRSGWSEPERDEVALWALVRAQAQFPC
jgi:hypothetical protein